MLMCLLQGTLCSADEPNIGVLSCQDFYVSNIDSISQILESAFGAYSISDM